MSALVSIIIPIYNVEAYIKECLDSIENQTYQNLEIICVNDGSPDKSRDIVLEYANRDNRIALLDKENGGLSDARNYGLDRCKGQYILLLDGDDYIAPSTIEQMVKNATEKDADIVIADFVTFLDGEQPKSNPKKKENFLCDGISAYKKAYDGQYLNLNVAWGKLYMSYLFKEYRYPVGKIHEDEFLTYKLITNAKRVYYMDTPLFYYRMRKGSIVNTIFSEKNLVELDALEERIHWFKSLQDYVLTNETAKLYMGKIINMFNLTDNTEIKKYLSRRYRAGILKYGRNIGVLRVIRGMIFSFSPKTYNWIEKQRKR